MSKYDPLTSYLAQSQQGSVRLSFVELEAILGFALPKSSKLYPAWWSNNDSSHVQASAWLSAGFETANLSLGDKHVDFVRTSRIAAGGQARGFGEMQQELISMPKAPAIEMEDLDGNKVIARHPAFGSLLGTTFVLPDVDLTAPADPDWGHVYDNGYHDAAIEGPAAVRGTRKAP